MNEIDFYEEFSFKFKKYLISYLNQNYKVYYACNGSLDNLIGKLENDSGIKVINHTEYIPKLKVDIIFLITCLNKPPHLILIEAKYLNQLSLKDYSQLTGYLQVAKIIEFGFLLLIQKGESRNRLSNDFQEIINLKKLPMNWSINTTNNNPVKFKTGILVYAPNNDIDWVDTKTVNGISSYDTFVNMFK